MKHKWKVLWDIDWTIIGIGFDIVLESSIRFGVQLGPLWVEIVVWRPDHD